MGILNFNQGKPAAWIRVTGEDAPGFLQSQFSNDLGKLPPNFATYGLWLDRKGKVQADSFVLETGPEEFRLFSYFSTAETIINKLQANIIADDVELIDETESISCICWWGEGAENFLHFLELEKSRKSRYQTFQTGYLISGRRSTGKNFDFVADKDEIQVFKEKVLEFGQKHTLSWVLNEGLQKERISSNIPAVPFDIGPRDFPQEGGLEKDAVCFDKGCYLGQEIMARLHTRGKTRRRLFGVRVKESMEIPSLPCELFDESESVGQLRSAVKYESGFQGLALIKTSFLEKSGSLSFYAGEKSNMEILLARDF